MRPEMADAFPYAERARRALALAEEAGADALVVRSARNRRYLTGFAGSAGTVVVSSAGVDLLVDFRYAEQAEEQSRAAGARVEVYERTRYHERLAAALARAGSRRPGFEAERESHAEWVRLTEKLAPDAEPVETRGIVERLRRVKSPGEIECLRRACEVTDQALAEALPGIRPGAKEGDIALEIELAMRRLGADGTSFDFIVASGPRGSRPHAETGSRELARGDFVTLDIGARWQGYCADLTRTVCVGEADARQREVYDLVLAALEASVAALRPGLTGREADAVARDMIAQAGHGDHFGHGLGHGVGLDVHEAPSLSSSSEDVLQEGEVVTVEPGVYIAGWGGVRIEDTVLLTARGAERLTASPRELIIL